jgi:aspartate kinase
MSIIVSTDSLLKCKDELEAEIESAVNPDGITFTDKLAMVAVVGNGMSKKIGIAARLFTALAEQGIIIKTIIFAPSELCVIIGIDEDYLETSIRSIYDTFIRD